MREHRPTGDTRRQRPVRQPQPDPGGTRPAPCTHGRGAGVTIGVRRVRAGEGARVCELRLRAVSDPVASIAFLTTREQELEREPAFWDERAAGGASGGSTAMFVAEDGDTWVGSVTVLVRRAGEIDHTGRRLPHGRADVVGVYVAPEARGSGAIDALLDAAARWTAEQGFETLSLDVHVDNHRAQAVYRRAGFVATGETFTGPIGAELAMGRSLRRL
ncbi:Ribosomal protein S18 acetylase RimI [Microbacterium testaceum StLB037]|uniref:Ribosomal protein S18 acetylase RimI n=1 Tax=Microbacterium testaceum (strain StLB037) TaxID=979556 RepID=A0A1H0NPV0_MICTS|nr:Ribosomal protein S18 acetylase RimI [Microbacterium testaceum StLB037]